MTDHALPALGMRALARRALVPIAVVVVAAVVAVMAGGPLRAFADALSRALDADPRWVAAAAVLEVLSFGGYVALLWLVGARATPRLGLRASAQVTLGGAAATRLLPTAGVGGAALTMWALLRAGLGARAATRTLLAFLAVLYSVFLGAIAGAGALLALGIAPGDGPLALSALPAAGAALAIAAGLWLATRRPATADADVSTAPAARHRSPARPRVCNVAGILGAAVRDALALARSGDPRLLGAVAWWAFDAAVLWAMLQAFGAPPSLAVVVLAYFVGQIGNTIPIPGAVSGGIVGMLLAFGVQADLALVSVLAYRALAIWLPAPIGLAALGALRRTVARWNREDAPSPGDARRRNSPHSLDSVPVPACPVSEPALHGAA
jgi:putative heme transporter